MQIEKTIFPSEIQKIIGNRTVHTDDIGRSGALVAFIGDELIIKRTEGGKLKNACSMQSFFHKNGIAPEVVYYESSDFDYMISRRADGKSAIDPENLASPVRLAGALGEFLLKIHSLDVSVCPVKDLTEGLYAEFDQAVLRNKGTYRHITDYTKIETIDEIRKIAERAKPYLLNDTVLHGDYCLPNIMLTDFSGKHVIDVGEGGVGDKHIDLFWGLWSLSYNLKTDQYRDVFLSAYGKNRLDEDLILACGCLCSPI